VRKLGKIKSNSEHDHALSVAKTFFTWAQNRRYIEDNPCRGLSPHGHKSRARTLSDHELKLIWNACEQRLKFRGYPIEPSPHMDFPHMRATQNDSEPQSGLGRVLTNRDCSMIAG
jgi:hypothetical protein